MTVFNVTIYIETSIKGPRAGRAAGAYLVEYITSKGTPVTKGGILIREMTTENALTLELMDRAFRKLQKMCSVRVITQCGHVLNAIKNEWIKQWEVNGWRNAKGAQVKNAELWEQLSEKMRKHLVEADTGFHSYQLLMQERIQKVLEGVR